MATVSGMGTTFNLPNFHGELIAVTPSDTPLLSAAGGLSGGLTTTSTRFEWQTEDLRDPKIIGRLEGAAAPTAESRSRSVHDNVVQIFHEQVSTSYTKQAASGQYKTVEAAPRSSADGGANPVADEHGHQVMNALKTMARDVNFAFWWGKETNPTTNAAARLTGGLIDASSNQTNAATVVTGLASGAANIISETATARANGDKIVFTVPPAELQRGRIYYVVNKATDSFKVAETPGGTAVTIATSQTGLAYYPVSSTALTVDLLNAFMQGIYDNGGISEQETATLFVSSRQRRALTTAYSNEYGKVDLFSGTRNIAGVSATTIQTDFGNLNVVVDRALPADTLAVVSLEQIAPVFLEIPGKGVLFEEELARTGSSINSQIYGEIGLKYGNPYAHGVYRGLAV